MNAVLGDFAIMFAMMNVGLSSPFPVAFRSMAYAWHAQARYITIATFTTSYTCTWKPMTMRFRHAPFMCCALMNPKLMWRSRMNSSMNETKKPNCAKNL